MFVESNERIDLHINHLLFQQNMCEYISHMAAKEEKIKWG
jgi:hypothetical protein